MTTIRSVRGRPGGPSKMPPLKPKPEQPVYQPSLAKNAKTPVQSKAQINQSLRQQKTPAKPSTIQQKGVKAKPKQDEDIWAQCEREYKETCEEFGYDLSNEAQLDWIGKMDTVEDRLFNSFYEQQLIEDRIALIVDDACRSIEVSDDPIETQKRINDAVIKALQKNAERHSEIATKRSEILEEMTQMLSNHTASAYQADTIPDPTDPPKRQKPVEPKGKMEPRARNLRK